MGKSLTSETGGKTSTPLTYQNRDGDNQTKNICTAFLPMKEENGETSSETSTDNEDRHTWSRKLEYMLTMIGYCVGLGNVWRFPYVCIRNGGGAFLIPFLICLLVFGLPLFFMEVAVGQFLSRGAYHVWNICPLFKGIGLSMNILCFLNSWYYGMIMAWPLIFAAHSMRSPLPWTHCGQSWNTEYCVHSKVGSAVTSGNYSANISMETAGISTSGTEMSGNLTILASVVNMTANGTRLGKGPSEEFWLYNVLELSPGLQHPDGIPWHSAVGMLVASAIAIACVIKGIDSVGKVVYITATLPYILLTIFIVKAAPLPGALDGILFYVTPDFSKLLRMQTWVEASLQVFYSLGPAWGSLITMASYNKFNNNCLRDSMILPFICEGTSLFSGFAIFTMLGHMAHRLDVPVANFSSSGPGLAYVVYPEAISYLPVPQLWGVLFFLMLFTVGLDSQFTQIETCITAITDSCPNFARRWNVIFKLAYATFLYLVSLPFAARGGMYLFQLVDWYIAAFSVCLNGILECLIVGWIYGADRFLDDIQMMLGKRPPYVFAIMWRFLTPLLLTSVLVSTLTTYKPPVYEGYIYGTLGVVIGWCIACISFVPIPAVAIYTLVQGKGSLWQRLKTACRPSSEWHPSDPCNRREYQCKLEMGTAMGKKGRLFTNSTK